MALFSACWFIVEAVLIPHGFRKWYCLRFFIHPILLILCQLSLWIEFLTTRLLSLVYNPIRITWYSILRVFWFLRAWILRKHPLGGSDKIKNLVDQRENERLEAIQTSCEYQLLALYHCSRVLWSTGETHAGEKEDEFEEEIEQHEEFDSIVDTSEDSANTDIDSSSVLEFSNSSASDSPVIEIETERDIEEEKEEVDEFYVRYCERMRWFDLLSYERTCGICSISNKKLDTSSLWESMDAMNFSLPIMGWDNIAKRKLIRSLESDFEMVYVGQACLCWEALHHQYRKVEALASSMKLGGAFYDDVAGKFQQFRVLLERFLENEKTEGKRLWTYVHRRSCLNNLLQVPEVPGYIKEGKYGMNRCYDSIFAREAIKVIEKSIGTFWVFIKTDNKKHTRKLARLLWADSQVEDPNDLALLVDLKKTLQKKELAMKHVMGRNRCCLQRTNPVDHSQRVEILFSMIDMKLVSRVLNMNVISSNQLKWCHQKIHSIYFEEGKVVRSWTSDYLLFPPS